MVEFDVRAWDGDLVLAHTIAARPPRRQRAPGQDALAHLAGRRFSDVELNVDVKHVGCEAALLDQLRHASLLERTLISSQVPGVLDRVRAIEPRARVGISIGGRIARMSRRWRDWRVGALAGMHSGRWDALMAQHQPGRRRAVGLT